MKNPLTYPLVSKSFGYFFIIGLGVFVFVANINMHEVDADTLSPSNLLTHYVVGEVDEIFTEQFEIDVFTEDSSITPVSGVTAAPLADESTEVAEDDSELSDIAERSGSLIKPTIIVESDSAPAIGKQDTYIVKKGDTVSIIAEKFDLKTNTVLWANDLGPKSSIKIGQELVILPVDGVLYKVKRGDTLDGIANNYKSDREKIVSQNKLAGYNDLKAGETILLPGGVPPAPARRPTFLAKLRNVVTPSKKPAPSSNLKAGKLGMIWPTSARRITQYFGWRHTGLDIAGPVSNKIYAAAAGRVVDARGSGYNGGYGKVIVIDHGGGRKTRYAHTSKIFVRPGQQVAKGETIAMMGSTGRSTGPHLHFEVISNGRKINPLSAIR